MTDQCRNCPHAAHTHPNGGACVVTTVDDPASTKGRKSGDGYDHIGRDVTPCPCTEFVTERNGVRR